MRVTGTKTTKAAVLVELNAPLIVADLQVPELGPGQVLIKVAFAGVCHTQVMECRGRRGPDPYLPHCLGHEGSGTVCQVGPVVTKVKLGDRVIMSWMKGSGANAPGTVYQWGSQRVNAGGVTTFSEHAVVSENRLTPIPADISMEVAALLGCAVPTGVGAVLNTAQPKPGQSIAVFGVGGIGLCAVAGAAIAGCTPIIAIDVRPGQRDLAHAMGATHDIDASAVDSVKEILRICPGGVDFAIEASGRTQVMLQALHSVRPQGGIAVIVGNAPFGERVNLDPGQLNLGKQLRGTWGGDNWPDRDFPSYCRFVQSGKLNLEALGSATYPLSRINEAVNDLESARVVRPIIDMGLG